MTIMDIAMLIFMLTIGVMFILECVNWKLVKQDIKERLRNHKR